MAGIKGFEKAISKLFGTGRDSHDRRSYDAIVKAIEGSTETTVDAIDRLGQKISLGFDLEKERRDNATDKILTAVRNRTYSGGN